MSELCDRLVAAHVQHELARWHGEGFRRVLDEWLPELFGWLAEVKLDDVATRAQITGIIERFVVELRVSGGITELSGEMSRVVFASRASSETRVEQLLSFASYREFSDKLFDLEALRRRLIGLIARSSSAGMISAHIIARAVLDVLTAPLPSLSASLREIAQKLSGERLTGLENKLASVFERQFERHHDQFARVAEQQLLEVLTADGLRSVVDEVWAGLGPMQLSEAFALIGEQDLEDFVVLVFEFWLRYRKTEFFHRISGELVDYFFRKYGQESLLLLIEDMGVTQTMVREELAVSLRPILDHAAASGFLERLIRVRLEGFYRSPAIEALLREPNDGA